MIVSDTLRVNNLQPAVSPVVKTGSAYRTSAETLTSKSVKVNRALLKVRPTGNEVSASEWTVPAEVEPYDTIIVPEAIRPVEVRQINRDSLLADRFVWERKIPTEDWKDGDSLVVKGWERTIVPTDGKMAGDPLAFRMASDNYIGSSLLVCFVMIALLVAHAQHDLALGIKEFFNDRQRENMFNDSLEGNVRGDFFFSLALCFSLGVLFLDYQQIYLPDVFREVSPYMILGINVAGCLLGYGLKTLLYAFVNMVFFDRDQKSKWMESYGLLTIAASVVMVPLASLVVFYEMDFSEWRILFSLSVIMIEIFLIFKTYRVFFEGLLGVLRLILYLCALEFLPLLCMWKGMVWVTQELTKLV